MKEKQSGVNFSTLFTVVISVLITAILLISALFWRDMTTLNKAYADMNKIEFISSSTQRLISLAQSNDLMQRDIFFIGDSTNKALKLNQEETISVLNNVEMVELSNEVIESWNQIEILVQETPMDMIDIGLAREKHYKAMTDLSNQISEYTTTLNANITKYQVLMLALFFAVAMIMLNNILRTHTELKQSKALAKTAQIDTATGLYNRSRCQEIFKNSQNITSKKQPAILVLDLNDLKKTNDTLGHRAGDELIQAFAKTLKIASQVHVVQPFIGRYGGDEFIVFYEDAESEADIKLYLKEVQFNISMFNENEARFKISYAAGYAFIKNGSNEKMTIRQLFDKADEAMYENKLAGKRAENPNYDEQLAKGEHDR